MGGTSAGVAIVTAKALVDRVRAFLLKDADATSARRFSALIESDAFRNVAIGYATEDDSETRLILLVMWLDLLSTTLNIEDIAKGIVDPHDLARHIREKQDEHHQHVETLKKIADCLRPQYAIRLRTLAHEIENDSFAMRGYGIPDDIVHSLLNMEDLGTTGSAASNPEGAWRGWIVRSLDDQLPADIDAIPNPWATVRDLLEWAGVDGVTAQDVAKIIKRKRHSRAP